MTSNASRRYGEALERLRINNPTDYRAVKCRVESWKSIADTWKTKAEELERTIARLEGQGASQPREPKDTP